MVDPTRADTVMRIGVMIHATDRTIVLRSIGTKIVSKGKGTLFFEIPEAHHHVMADEPLALVTATRAIIAAWSV